MKPTHLIQLLFILLLSACSQSVKVVETKKLNPHFDQFYLQHVQPIFDAKCIACHSCYNAPCQLDLTTFEGVLRGSSKKNIYDFPALHSNSPTRLGIDGTNVHEWRKKEFYSIVGSKHDKSILGQVLRPVDPKIFKGHIYLPEENRTCNDDPTDEDYFLRTPRGHMPYGFPDLTTQEKKKVDLWISFGAPEFSPETEREVRQSVHADANKILALWETYLNENSFKSKLRSRYIYEHLFLALLSFEALPGEHYRLVRAVNDEGEPIEIPTVRPFDDAGPHFYYRFKKYIRTVMDKSNMPYVLNDKKMARWKKLFDERPLLEGSAVFPQYGDVGSNAFKTFRRLDPKSRYEFLLDDAYYHIMTFIKGPVCRGPTALNVINDHFWVFFMDPNKDPTLGDSAFLATLEGNMFPPSSTEDQIKSFNGFRKNFWSAVEKKYQVYEKNNFVFSQDKIWNGGPDANQSALLTIFRHFDSAQVMKGSLGTTPKTAWVLDYHVFEDIYYNLVSGYNVFGPLIHQVNTRLYMEISRISSEDLFLNFMNKETRLEERKKWSLDVPKKKETVGLKVVKKIVGSSEDKMHFKYPYLGKNIKTPSRAPKDKTLLLNQILKSRFSKGDFKVKDALIDKNIDKKVLAPGAFVKFMPEVVFLKIDGLGSEFYTLIRNRYHYNVSMLFFENERENSDLDYLSLVEGVGASYPNAYMTIKKNELIQWQRELLAVNSTESYKKFVDRFGVSRHREDFWDVHAWYNNRAYELLGKESGRFDLSRFDQ